MSKAELQKEFNSHKFNPKTNIGYVSTLFRTPSELFGNEVTQPVVDLFQQWVKGGATYEAFKQDIVPELKDLQKEIEPRFKGAKKVAYKQYMESNINLLNGRDLHPVMAFINDKTSKAITSTMKFNLNTSMLHALTSTQRMVSMDMSEGGVGHYWQGLMKAIEGHKQAGWTQHSKTILGAELLPIPEVQQFGSYGANNHTDLGATGLLHNVDTFMASVAHYTAEAKYGENTQMRQKFQSYATMRYALGDTPQYLANNSIRQSGFFALSRFSLRHQLDVFSHIHNIAEYINAPDAETKEALKPMAVLSANAIVGGAITGTFLFGTSELLPGIFGSAATQGSTLLYNLATGNDVSLRSIEDAIDNQIPGAHILKYANLDYSTQHDNIPMFVKFSMAQSVFGDGYKIFKDIKNNDLQSSYTHTIDLLVDGSAYTGLPGTDIQPLKSTTKALGRALSGRIGYDEIGKDFLETTFDEYDPSTDYGKSRKAYLQGELHQDTIK